MRIAWGIGVVVCLFASSSRAAAQQPSAADATLHALDRAGIHDEQRDYSTLSDTDRGALGVALLQRVATPRGMQAGVGPTYAYLMAARYVPNGADVALAFLRRPVRRVTSDTSALFDAALDTLGAHERDGGASPAVCAVLEGWLHQPPASLFRGRTPALRIEAVALAASACPGGLQLRDDVTEACHATVGTECDAARLRAGDPVRRRELVTFGLGIATHQPDSAVLAHWGQMARAFVRAGDDAPVGDLLPLLDSTVVRHVPVMYSDGPHGGSTTYGDVGIADLYVALAVEAWHLPVHFAPTPRGALAERVYTAAERNEVRQLVRHRVTMASPP